MFRGSGGDVNFLIPGGRGRRRYHGVDQPPVLVYSRIGTWGTSWAGWTQTALAGAGAGQSRHHGPEHERQQRT